MRNSAFSMSSIVAGGLPLPFNVSTKTLTRAVTRTKRNQIENWEKTINGVVGG